MNYETMTDDELVSRYNELRKTEVHCDVEQLTRKIQINSLYGALN